MLNLRRRFLLLPLITVLAGSSPLVSKSKNKNQDQSPDLTLKSQTELVLVPVIVTDKSKAHVTGLKQEDFRLLENGVEERIATFEEATSGANPLKYSANPGEFSNFSTDSAQQGRVTLIVIDFLNTSSATQVYVRQELIKYLTSAADQHEPTAIFTLTRSGIQVIHDFTSDPRILSAALRNLAGGESQAAGSPKSSEPASGTGNSPNNSDVDPRSVQNESERIHDMLQSTNIEAQPYEQALAIRDTLNGLQTLARAFRGFPARKSLVWITEGFPFGVSTNSMLPGVGRFPLADVVSGYERTWQMLDDAEISLYPVDAKGLAEVWLPPHQLEVPNS